MMLRFSLNQEAAPRCASKPLCKKVLSQGLRTADIYSAGTQKRQHASEMGDAVAQGTGVNKKPPGNSPQADCVLLRSGIAVREANSVGAKICRLYSAHANQSPRFPATAPSAAEYGLRAPWCVSRQGSACAPPPPKPRPLRADSAWFVVRPSRPDEPGRRSPVCTALFEFNF